MTGHAPWMERALFLAERGRGRTNPNPLVGAVVVSADGIVLGQGAHLVAGEPHAEVHALAAAGESARGATLYCTLEPCCHTGRTGPCTDAIIRAGVSRVVTAVDDPNPRVAGGGHARLRAAGVEVITGVGGAQARAQNAPFFMWMTHQRPWTIIKTAASSDGFVGAPHHAGRLTGAETDRWMHRQRAWLDAIAIGADTAIADDPLLTPRGAWRARPLTRVIVDWRGRVPAEARIYSTLSTGPVIMVGLQSVPAPHRERLQALGVEVELCAERSLTALVARLAARSVQSLLVEGGPVLQQAWIAAGLADAVQYVEAPLRLGAGVPVAPALSTWRHGQAMSQPRMLGMDRLVEGLWA